MNITKKISIKDLKNKVITVEDLKGKIIVFPTDTVYGVATLYGDKAGVEKIYQMKRRDYGKPLPVLFDSVDAVTKIARIDDKHYKYTEFWPGPLTMILNRNDNQGTLACRIPNSQVSLDVIRYFGPLYTTSVNYSGEKELNDVDEIISLFGEFVDYIITDKNVLTKTPSTIIDCTDTNSDNVKVLRQGGIIIK